jgi:thiamine biosynthesis lipoprotein
MSPRGGSRACAWAERGDAPAALDTSRREPHRPDRAPARGCARLVVALVLSAASAGTAPAAAPPTTIELYGNAFHQVLWIEARPASAAARATAERALRDAVAAVREVEDATSLERGPLAALDAAAGGGAVAVPAVLLHTLQRASSFCQWSQGIHGPLGGVLAEVWGMRVPRPGLPTDNDLQRATAAAACDGLLLDEKAGTAKLAAGARADLWAFAPGAAVDAAIERLRGAKLTDVSVTLGAVQRAVGTDGQGKGWPLRVTLPAGLTDFGRNLRVRDEAVALATAEDAPLRAGGEVHAPYLDQHEGRPPSGTMATLVLTDLALDAQGVAGAAFATGNRRGTFLLGQLDPPPAVLWLFGDGSAHTLVADFHWGVRVRRP